MRQPRHFQRPKFFVAAQFPAYRQIHFAWSKPRLFDRRLDFGGVKTPIGFRREDGFPCRQIDFYFADAFQASQGLFGPVGSKRSRQALDLYVGLSDLGLESGGKKTDGEKKEQAGCGLRQLGFHVHLSEKQISETHDEGGFRFGLSAVQVAMNRKRRGEFQHQTACRQVFYTRRQVQYIAA